MFVFFFILATLSGWTSGEASSKGLSNILHGSVPGRGIAGLLRSGVCLLTSFLNRFCFYQSYPRGQNAFTSVQKKAWSWQLSKNKERKTGRATDDSLSLLSLAG